MAVGAHPDDIEFMMAGTLLLLKRAGARIHMWNIANGSCGTEAEDRDAIVLRRGREAQASAAKAGAVIHPPLVDDIAIFYDAPTLARAAAVVRQVQPDILLVPSPQDYMEDHQNACRLAVTAAFTRGMRNFPTDPPVPPYSRPVALYHALPYGLRDGLRRLVRPGQFVDIGGVLSLKREMLAEHRSQKDWLDASQGVDAYLNEMDKAAREVGRMSGRFECAEGWRRHSHLGFGPEGADPLKAVLGEACWVDPEYEASLGMPGAGDV